MANNYTDENQEMLQINDILFNILPSDMSLFSDNDIRQETYLRSKGAYSFRSKHSNSKISLTFPMPLLNLDAQSSYSSQEQELNDNCVKLIGELNNFPFCFIRSARIYSYLGVSFNTPNSYLMFGVEEIQLVQDLRVPDVMFIEISLLFHNHMNLVKDLKFANRLDIYRNGKGIKALEPVEELAASSLYTNYMDKLAKKSQFGYNTMVDKIKSLEKKGNYVPGSPFSYISIAMPHIVQVDDMSIECLSGEVKSLKPEGIAPTTTFKLYDKYSSTAKTFDFAGLKPTKDLAELAKNPAMTLQDYELYHLEDKDIFNPNINAIQSIRVVRSNTFAKHHIGSSQHPYLQYMGRNPTSLAITSIYNTYGSYELNLNSTFNLFKVLLNSIDTINTQYPTANAYNYLKIKSLATELLGVDSFIPGQCVLQASADSNGIETYQTNFIENSMATMKEEARITEGKLLVNSDRSMDAAKALQTYLNKLKEQVGANKLKDIPFNFMIMSLIADMESYIDNELIGRGEKKILAVKDKSGKDLIQSEADKARNKALDSADSTTIAEDIKAANTSNEAASAASIKKMIPKAEKVLRLLGLRGKFAEDKQNKTNKVNSNIKFTIEDGEKTKDVDQVEMYNFDPRVDEKISALISYLSIASDKGYSTMQDVSKDPNVQMNISSMNDAALNMFGGEAHKDLQFSLIEPTESIRREYDPFFFVDSEPYIDKKVYYDALEVINTGAAEQIKSIITAQVKEGGYLDGGNEASRQMRADDLQDVKEKRYKAEAAVDRPSENPPAQAAGSTFSDLVGGSTSTYTGEFPPEIKASIGSLQNSQGKSIGTGYSPGVRALMDFVMRMEATFKYGYTTVFGGGNKPNLTSIPHPGSEGRGSSAAGAFQWMGSGDGWMGVWGGANPVMSVDNQNKGFVKILQQRKTGLYEAVEKGDWNTAFNLRYGNNGAIGSIWASIPENNYTYNGKRQQKSGWTKEMAITACSILQKFYEGAQIGSPIQAGFTGQAGAIANAESASKNVQGVAGTDNRIITRRYLDGASTTPLLVTPIGTAGSPLTVQKERGATEQVKVVGIISGDTIVAQQGSSKPYLVKIGGIAAPVVANTDASGNYLNLNQEGGQEAKAALAQKMPIGSTATITFQEEGAVGANTIQANVQNMNGVDMGSYMMASGWASQGKDSDGNYTTLYRSEMTKASNMKAGIWKNKVIDPDTFRTQNKSKIAQVVEQNKRMNELKGVTANTNPIPVTTPAGSSPAYKGAVTNDYCPVAPNTKISSPYGWRKLSGFRWHSGTDYPCPVGTPVKVAAKGRVVSCGNGNGGKNVLIDHGNGFQTFYCHGSDNNVVKPGQVVEKGDVVMKSGNTAAPGHSTGPHLHYEVRFNGQPVNSLLTAPLDQIPYGVAANAATYIHKDAFLSASSIKTKDGSPYKNSQSATIAKNLTNTNGNVGGASPGDAGGTPTAPAYDLSSVDEKNVKGYSFLDVEVAEEASVYDEANKTDKHVAKMFRNIEAGLNISFPTFKGYCVIGNEDEEPFGDAVPLRSSIYFELPPLQNVSISCNNDNNPIDVCTFSVINPSASRTIPEIYNEYIAPTSYYNINTQFFNAFKGGGLKIKPGMRVQIRGGYANNVNKLPIVFNGIVRQTSGDMDLMITCVCDSYASELVSNVLGQNQPEDLSNHKNASTGLLISYALLQDNISHFGTKLQTASTVAAYIGAGFKGLASVISNYTIGGMAFKTFQALTGLSGEKKGLPINTDPPVAGASTAGVAGGPSPSAGGSAKASSLISNATAQLGKSSDEDIIAYQKAIGVGGGPKAWCASFTGAMLKASGFDYLDAAHNGASSLAYAKYGVAIDKNATLPPGTIVVEDHGGGEGHVSIVTKDNGDGTVSTISGNTSDQVGQSSKRSKSNFIAARIPTVNGVPITQAEAVSTTTAAPVTVGTSANNLKLDNNTIVVGDSLSVGVGHALGVPENEKISKGGQDTVWVKNQIKKNKAAFAGKTILLSTGITNDFNNNWARQVDKSGPQIDSWSNIEQQMQTLNSAGAKVVVLGVVDNLGENAKTRKNAGDDTSSAQRASEVNSKLQAIATKYNSTFADAGKGGSDSWHPNDYNSIVQKYNSGATGTVSSTPTTPTATTSASATTAKQYSDGTNANTWTASTDLSIPSGVPSDQSVLGDKGRLGDFRDPENKGLVAPINMGEFLWNAVNLSAANLSQRLFVNVYCDAIEFAHDAYKSSWWARYKNLISWDSKVFYNYWVFRSTSWSVIKEMEYRHPGTLAKPLWYEDRQTLFFGTKEQLYVAKDLDYLFMNKAGQVNRFKDPSMPFSKQYAKERIKRLEPATGFHLLSSRMNIISNGMGLNANYATKINVIYYKSKFNGNDVQTDSTFDTVVLDDNLLHSEIREKTIAMNGTHGQYMSWMYGINELRRQCETMYTGHIIVTGNPEMKAGDYAYLEDTERGLSGIIKIRECEHHYSAQDGYITIITPGQYVECTQFIWDTLFIKLGMASKMSLMKLDNRVTTNLTANKIANTYIDVLSSLQSNQQISTADKIYSLGGTIMMSAIVPYLTARALLGSSVVNAGLKAGVRSVFSQQLGTIFNSFRRGGNFGLNAVRTVSTLGVNGSAKLTASVSQLTKGRVVGNIVGNTLKVTSKVANVGGLAGKMSSLLKGMKNILTLGNFLKYGKIAGSIARGAGYVLGGVAGIIAANPIALAVEAVIGMLFSVVVSKFDRLRLTHNAVTLFPVTYMDRPYTAGMTGYSNNGIIEGMIENMKHTVQEMKNAEMALESNITDSSGIGNSAAKAGTTAARATAEAATHLTESIYKFIS